jgi:hypothetical protein
MNKLKLNSRSQVFRKYRATIKVPIEQPPRRGKWGKVKEKERLELLNSKLISPYLD